MSDDKIHTQDAMLDDLFTSARRQEEPPSAQLMHRLNADMERLLPRSQQEQPRKSSENPFTAFRRLFAASGLAGAAALGVWIGLVFPETLNSVASEFTTSEYYGIEDFLPSANLAALVE